MKPNLQPVESEPPDDFGSMDGPDLTGMGQAIEIGRLRRQLAKAEAFLATIAKGVNDPCFHAAKYWGGYKKYDEAMKKRTDAADSTPPTKEK